MITSFAELLREFSKKEVVFLDSQDIKHTPTIGRMYEGLAHEIVNRSIPKEWGLNVVDGFITNKNGELSNQIDCMLVIGSGERIPYTDSYKYDIDNVLAVLEIKKNLYSAELSEAYGNLKSVYDIYQRKEFNKTILDDAYKSITQEHLPSQSEFEKFPVWKDQIYRTLFSEAILPVRIALGYHGFSKEINFRKAFIKYIEDNIGNGVGVGSLPSLIISDTYSIVKLNGMPYSTPINDEENYWHILASYSGNPLILLLELLWTKLTYHFGFTIAGFSDSLTLEVLHPLLKAKAIEFDGKIGWEYVDIILKEGDLSSVSLFESWKPVEIDDLQFSIIQRLIEKDEISTSSDWFTTLIKHPSYSSATLSKLITSGLISKKGEILRLLTIECKVVVMSDGSIVAGEDNSGRLTSWVENRIKEKRREGNKNA